MTNEMEGAEEMEQRELTLEESNIARLQAMNALGFGVNGVNEALTNRMLERVLGPVATAQAKEEHQKWLSDQLDMLEEQVQKIQRQQTLMALGNAKPRH